MKKRRANSIDTADKAEAICLMLKAGVQPEQICRWFGMSDRTLRWYRKFGGCPCRVGRPKKNPHPYHQR